MDGLPDEFTQVIDEGPASCDSNVNLPPISIFYVKQDEFITLVCSL